MKKFLARLLNTDNTDGVTMASKTLLEKATVFARREMEALKADSSHDWWHVARVTQTAKSLSNALNESGTPCDGEIVELAALLHDVREYKYTGDEGACEVAVREFLGEHSYPAARTETIVEIIKTMGFKNSLPSGPDGKAPSGGIRDTPEFGCVSDADKLDAIGAVGIARTFSFGGKKGTPFYDPAIPPRTGLDKSSYTGSHEVNPTVNHFHEKLLKLKDMMLTEPGRKVAQNRHIFMEIFLKQFHAEFNGTA